MLLVFGFSLEMLSLFCPNSGNVFCGRNTMLEPLSTIIYVFIDIPKTWKLIFQILKQSTISNAWH